jgi:hypothetical protein
MKLGTWLLSLMQPLIGRILAALGFSVVTITGMDAIFTQVKASLVSGISGLGADMFNAFLISGGGEALGIITGAIATRLLLWQIQQSTKILGVNPG